MWLLIRSFYITIICLNLGSFGDARKKINAGPYLVMNGFKYDFANNKDLTLKTGENLRIICGGFYPVRLERPLQQSDTKCADELVNKCGSVSPIRIITRIEYTSKQIGDRFEIKIYNTVTVEDVGYYKCWQKNESVSVYLFVEDPGTPLAPFKIYFGGERLKNPILSGDKTSVIFPCKPTSLHENLTIYVYFWGNQLFQSKTNYDLVHYSKYYDPKYGFYNASNILNGQYSCRYYNNSGHLTDIQFQFSDEVEEIPDPVIDKHAENRYYFVGMELQLHCNITFARGNMNLKWKLPPKVGCRDPRVMIHITEKLQSTTNFITMTSTLTIKDLRESDSGDYICSSHNSTTLMQEVVPTHDVTNITIHGKKYLMLQSHTPTIINENAGQPRNLTIQIFAYPPVQCQWFFNGHEIQNTAYIMLINSNDSSTLQMYETRIENSGHYMFKVKNPYAGKTENFTLNFTSSPSIEETIKGPEYVFPNQTYYYTCVAQGNPKPQIKWYFYPCSFNDVAHNKCTSNHLEASSEGRTSSNYSMISILKFQTNSSGVLQCIASVDDNFAFKNTGITVTDVLDGFSAWISTKNVVVGDTIFLNCSVHGPNQKLTWSVDVKNITDFKLENHMTKYSTGMNLILKNVTKKMSANYTCKHGERQSINVSLNVLDPVSPEIYKTNLKNRKTKEYVKLPFNLSCYARGVPFPTIIWYKNNKIWRSFDERIKITDDNQSVIFNFTTKMDQGKYKCVVKNRLATTSQYLDLIIEDENDVTNINWSWIIAVITLLLAMLAIIFIYLWVKLRRKKKVIEELELKHFNTGNLDSINPNLNMNEQAGLLPYNDKDWEFPRDKLKLNRVLDGGEFGIVMQADAYGIFPEEDCTTVAVKMVRHKADSIHLKALLTELKIMAHLGVHINIVNLLGACTKQLVSKRELCVIVEYCPYGSLSNYLQKQRKHFINQIDRSTGEISRDVLNECYHSPSTSAEESLHFLLPPKVVTSDGSVRSHGSFDQHEGVCTENLVLWAYQVARGMDYLASRRVLHCDLAARNVLLSVNNIVKICDFGLSKSNYDNINYVKKSAGPLPYKWLALECLRDGIFSTESDIWSFGIFLWEIFSLAQEPYPGLTYDGFLQKLENGYRLSKPEYAPRKVYQIMKLCWEYEPKDRPLFAKLAEDLGLMLEETKRQQFSGIDSCYMKMNDIKFSGDAYVKMSRVNADQNPTNMSNFLYVNSPNVSKPNDYLTMSSKL